jgi:hypothetical protein
MFFFGRNSDETLFRRTKAAVQWLGTADEKVIVKK